MAVGLRFLLTKLNTPNPSAPLNSHLLEECMATSYGSLVCPRSLNAKPVPKPYKP